MSSSFTGQGVDVVRNAGADLSSSQFKFIKLNSSNQAVVCDTSGEQIFGVLQNAPKSGEGALIRVFGPTKVLAGGSITSGNVCTNASGVAIAAGTGKKVAGVAMDSAASGDVTTVHVAPGYIALP